MPSPDRHVIPTWATWLTVAFAALLWTHGLLLILQWFDVM